MQDFQPGDRVLVLQHESWKRSFLGTIQAPHPVVRVFAKPDEWNGEFRSIRKPSGDVVRCYFVVFDSPQQSDGYTYKAATVPEQFPRPQVASKS